MIRRIKAIAALLTLLAASLLGSPAAAQGREVTDPPAVWAHKFTGVHFPSRKDDFVRVQIFEYNDEGSDASVGYDLIRNGRKIASVTIYIYPPFAIGGCENQYEDLKKSIFQAPYDDTRLLSEDRVPSPSGANDRAAYHARFSFAAPFDGQRVPVLSDAYLFCPAGDKWLVAYRATWLKDEVIDKDVIALFRSFDWPDMLDN